MSPDPPTTPAATPWQLRMFSKSLKKQQKLRLLLHQVRQAFGLSDGPLDPKLRCLLLTHGDNNGALNLGFRRVGGHWTWVDHEPEQLPAMTDLLGEPVLLGRPDGIPCDDASYDLVVAIDVHEHLDQPEVFNRELSRVAAPGARVVVTTPNGDAGKAITRLKGWLGMDPAVYGHRVIGYTLEDHRRMLAAVGLEPMAEGSYSGTVTELLELAINFTYVKVLGKGLGKALGKALGKSLGKRKGEPPKTGTIAPSSQGQLEDVGLAFRLYTVAYPLLALLARLDALDPTTGYAVSVVARQPDTP